MEKQREWLLTFTQPSYGGRCLYKLCGIEKQSEWLLTFTQVVKEEDPYKMCGMEKQSEWLLTFTQVVKEEDPYKMCGMEKQSEWLLTFHSTGEGGGSLQALRREHYERHPGYLHVAQGDNQSETQYRRWQLE